MANKVILVLSVSAGAGHVRASEALVAWGKISYPNYTIRHVDIMTLVPKLFKKVYIDSYLKIIQKFPAFWGYIYDKTDREKANSKMAKIRIATERLNTTKLTKLINETSPEHIICTHFLPAEILSRRVRKHKLNIPVWVVDTDFDLHSFWIQKQMTGYFCATNEVAYTMAQRGIPKETITTSGIPIMPEFSKKYSRKECATQLGISDKLPTVLLMSGGLGIGKIDEIAERLLTNIDNFQIIALAGKNKILLKKLKAVEEKHPNRMVSMPFTNTIHRIMAASDIIISKPGGLTTSESLAMGLPILVLAPLPGQEERNADYLLENGAALKAVNEIGVVYKIRDLINNPKKLEILKQNAKKLKNPKAGKTILDTVLNP